MIPVKISFNQAKALVKNKFDTWIIKSIKATLTITKDETGQNTSPLVTYLLLSCAIDIIAGFYSGRDEMNPRPGTLGRQYKEFLKAYMSNYDPEIIYKGLRCALAHNFVLDPTLALITGRPELHNQIDHQNRLTINMENMLDEFELAVSRYFQALESNIILQKKFKQRFEKLGFVGLGVSEYKIKSTSTNMD